MKFIYKLLFACVSGAINFAYYIHETLADVYVSSAGVYYRCTRCDGGLSTACSYISRDKAVDTDANGNSYSLDIGGEACAFFGALSCGPSYMACDSGSFWNPITGACDDTCPGGGYLTDLETKTYMLVDEDNSTKRHWYGAWACDMDPNGNYMGGWHDCQMVDGYSIIAGVGKDVGVCNFKLSGLTIEACETNAFADETGGGKYSPSCGYTL